MRARVARAPQRRVRRLLVAIAVVSVVVGAMSVTTASNSIPPTRLGQQSQATGVTELRPAACASLALTSLVVGTGNFSGTSANDLILASRGARRIRGGAGNDCILGGADATELDGQSGTDVCIGPTAATFRGCETTIMQ